MSASSVEGSLPSSMWQPPHLMHPMGSSLSFSGPVSIATHERVGSSLSFSGPVSMTTHERVDFVRCRRCRPCACPPAACKHSSCHVRTKPLMAGTKTRAAADGQHQAKGCPMSAPLPLPHAQEMLQHLHMQQELQRQQQHHHHHQLQLLQPYAAAAPQAQHAVEPSRMSFSASAALKREAEVRPWGALRLGTLCQEAACHDAPVQEHPWRLERE